MSLMYFSGFLSISLRIINLMPFPALDGGHLVMPLLETIRRKPLYLKTHQIVTALGMLVFIVLTVFITYKDIAGLIA